MEPKEESFWQSKTMQLLFLAFGLIVLLVILAVAVEVLFDVEVFSVIAAAIGAITALAGGGTARNAIVDGPVRQQYASFDVAQKVTQSNVPDQLIPQILSGKSPQVWTPPPDQSKQGEQK